MKTRIFVTPMLALAALAVPGLAQPAPPAPRIERQDALDPTPVNPAVDPDVRLFLNEWRNAKPRKAFGAMVFHDILTPLDSADPLRPKSRGAVLNRITALSRATLAPGATATGRMPDGQMAAVFTSEGQGDFTVNGVIHKLKDGIAFNLNPSHDFKLTNTGKTPMALYFRTEPLAPGPAAAPEFKLVSRWEIDRRVGAHWVHICGRGPVGMTLCTIAPGTMPQPHSHNFEELWLAVKGESVLMLGKTLTRMRAGQAYKIPPNGLVAHSNINLGDEPIMMIHMGPIVRGTREPLPDYAQLENTPIDPVGAPDIDMFIGNWRDAYPRIAHGNLYMRDMLSAGDGVKPVRTGAVLAEATAISHAMLEPGATAHRVEGAATDRQEIFIVAAGTGRLVAGGRELDLAPGQAFILGPEGDFQLTATGNQYLSFHVIAEKLAPGQKSSAPQLIDHQSAPAVTTAWHNKERPAVTPADGLARYKAITTVVLEPFAMSRPYSAAAGTEEIWIALDDVDLLLGKQLRKLKAGTAYKVPATGITAHSNINLTDKPARFLHISTAH